MTRIYRVANKDGNGPFYRDAWPAKYHDQMSVLMYPMFEPDDGHPLPQDDGIPAYPERWGDVRFGFESCAALHAWFTDAQLDAISRYGYHPKVYDVPDDAILWGDHQLVFDATRATRVSVGEADSSGEALPTPLFV